MSVDESCRPVFCCSELTKCSTARDSMPRSMSEALGEMSSVVTRLRTTSRTVSRASDAVSCGTAASGTGGAIAARTAACSGSTQLGFFSAPRSPSGESVSMIASSRRMNLPLYVSGTASATMNFAGTAILPSRCATSPRSRPSSAARSVASGCRTTKATGTVPSTSSGMPTTTQLRSGEPAVSVSVSKALSISSVPMRLPPTLITSSERPWKVNAPSGWRMAASPCT